MNRFYKARDMKLTRWEKAFADSSDYGVNFLLPLMNGKHTRREAEYGKVLSMDKTHSYQITYSFSNAVRNNIFPGISGVPITYGAKGFTYRMLYEFLCNSYNNGVYFIDTYFEYIFRQRAVFEQFDSIGSEIRNSIIAEYKQQKSSVPKKKDGSPDMRYNRSKDFKRYKAWQDPIIIQKVKQVSEAIQRDIIVCLSTGRIPLAKRSVSDETMRKRARISGMTGSKFFYASGQLIEHLRIFIHLEDLYEEAA